MTATDTAARSSRQPGDIGWRADRQTPGVYNVLGPSEIVKPGEVVTVTSRDGRTRSVLVQRVSRPFTDQDTGEEVCFGYLDDQPTKSAIDDGDEAVSEEEPATSEQPSGPPALCPTCGQALPETATPAPEPEEYEEPF